MGGINLGQKGQMAVLPVGTEKSTWTKTALQVSTSTSTSPMTARSPLKSLLRQGNSTIGSLRMNQTAMNHRFRQWMCCARSVSGGGCTRLGRDIATSAGSDKSVTEIKYATEGIEVLLLEVAVHRQTFLDSYPVRILWHVEHLWQRIIDHGSYKYDPSR